METSDPSMDTDPDSPPTTPPMEEIQQEYLSSGGSMESLGDSTTDKSSSEVMCTLSVAMALPRGEEELDLDKESSEKQMWSAGANEVVKAQNFYRIEFSLLPGTTKPVVADVLDFGCAAKLYTESETKVIHPWYDGSVTWLSWSQTMKVKCTKNLLVKFLSHKMALVVWDSKERVSFRAKIDKPKAYQLLQGKGGESRQGAKAETRNLVQKMKNSVEKTPKPSPSEEQPKVFSDPGKLKGGSVKGHIQWDESAESKPADTHSRPAPASQKQMSTQEKQPENLVTSQTARSMSICDYVQKNAVASANLRPQGLLAGNLSVTEQLECFTATVQAGFCSISVDQPLLSDDLKAELVPLIITIQSISSLPSTPVPYHVLQEKCKPVFCQYKFHNELHKTKGREHSANVLFGDVNVVFTGLMEQEELHELLGGPPMQVEIHDRDRKKEDAQQKHPDPFGVAHVDLSDLLNGRTILKINAPIKCSTPPYSTHIERKYRLDGPEASPIPVGNYLQASSELKVRVEITSPLDLVLRHSAELPLGRIIYLVKRHEHPAVDRMRAEVLKINAAALQVSTRHEAGVELALGCSRMSKTQIKGTDVDVITGFHLCDGEKHLFVLEGLKEKAIKTLWEVFPIKLLESEDVHILYNSQLSFPVRLYGELSVSLETITLPKSLETILREPLVYVRDVLPQLCFQALSRLSFLLQVTGMKQAVKSDLFPSSSMILSMRKQFELLPFEEEAAWQESYSDIPEIVIPKKPQQIDAYNSAYVQMKARQKLHPEYKNFIQANVEKVHQASLKVQKPKPAVIEAEVSEGETTYSYSMQALNSSERAWQTLRQQLSKDPKRRFTFNQEYQWATVSPVDPVAEAKERSEWRSNRGFVCPGYKSSIQSNKHPLFVDQMHVEMPRGPWREHILPDSIERVSLTRELWPWDRQDFERYKKASPFFSSPDPISIYMSEVYSEGGAVQQEQLSTNSQRPEFKVHLGQFEHLMHKRMLLKDKPQKLSLKKPGMVLKPIPTLPVLSDSWAKENIFRAYGPGPLKHHSLSWNTNHIPRPKTEPTDLWREHWNPKPFQYKRSITPLSTEDKLKFPRGARAQPCKTSKTSDWPLNGRNITETRTYADVIVHVI